MTLIDADKFLAYLIYSKHIDGLTCGEVKEAIEMCKVDVLDRIRAEFQKELDICDDSECDMVWAVAMEFALEVIDKYREVSK